jgi:pimeloyl-ACP methyl ester carboxylesterase
MLTGSAADYLDTARARMQHRGWRRLPVTTKDGVALDSMVWVNPHATGECGPKWCVHFLGNGGRYEDAFAELEIYAKELGVSVCGMNYRGVGRSEGLPWSFDELVLDGEAVLAAVVARAWAAPNMASRVDLKKDEMGLTAADVLLHGHSMGGAVATRVRALHPGGGLVNDRSFSNLHDVPIGWAKSAGALHALPGWAGRLLCGGVRFIMSKMGWGGLVHAKPAPAGWLGGAGAAGGGGKVWDVVAEKSVLIFHRKDEVLPYPHCSLHMAEYNAADAPADSGGGEGEDQNSSNTQAAANRLQAAAVIEIGCVEGDGDQDEDEENDQPPSGSPHNDSIVEMVEHEQGGHEGGAGKMVGPWPTLITAIRALYGKPPIPFVSQRR